MGKEGDIVLGIPGDFKSERLDDFVGIRTSRADVG
jgi:hypothetical protein